MSVFLERTFEDILRKITDFPEHLRIFRTFVKIQDISEHFRTVATMKF